LRCWPILRSRGAQLPSQLIAPANGILSLLLDRAAAALLPSPDGQGCGVIERN